MAPQKVGTLTAVICPECIGLHLMHVRVAQVFWMHSMHFEALTVVFECFDRLDRFCFLHHCLMVESEP